MTKYALNVCSVLALSLKAACFVQSFFTSRCQLSSCLMATSLARHPFSFSRACWKLDVPACCGAYPCATMAGALPCATMCRPAIFLCSMASGPCSAPCLLPAVSRSSSDSATMSSCAPLTLVSILFSSSSQGDGGDLSSSSHNSNPCRIGSCPRRPVHARSLLLQFAVSPPTPRSLDGWELLSLASHVKGSLRFVCMCPSTPLCIPNGCHGFALAHG
jgi:hypothetical protein